MNAAHYAPGALRAAITPRGFAVLDAGTPASAVRAAWEQVHAGNGIGGVIDVLAQGGPLSALPAFAVVVDEGDAWRVAVRGALTVSVTHASGVETVDGSAASTWSELRIPGAVAVALGGDPGPDALAVRDGMVDVAALVLTRDEASGTPARAADARPAEPVQPHTIAEVHDEPVARAAAPAHEATGITDSLPDHLRPPARTAPGERRPIPGIAPSTAPEGPAPISFVPGASSTPIPPAAAPEPVAEPARVSVAAPTPSAPPEAMDDDLESTVMRHTGEPAPRVVGDHDGETVSLAEARAMRGGAGLPAATPPVPPPPPVPRIPGRLRVSTGQVVALDRAVVIGRRPRSTRVSGTELPHLIAVDSPQQDISRSHVEVRPEGDSILATDLQTTNGTTLRRAGADPVRLHPGESTMLVPGDVLDLGDGITVAVEPAS